MIGDAAEKVVEKNSSYYDQNTTRYGSMIQKS